MYKSKYICLYKYSTRIIDKYTSLESWNPFKPIKGAFETGAFLYIY